MDPLWLIPLLFASYLFGNFNFSVFITKYILKKDLRKFQSGNPGAMNMIRNFGLAWGLLILALDMLKGLIPALLGFLLLGDSFVHAHIPLYACGLAAVVGHCFPIFYKFKGGKGIATAMGVFFFVNPVVSIIVFICCGLYLLIFEYGAMMSLMFVTIMIIIQVLTADGSDLTVCVLLFSYYFLMFFNHHANIGRLLMGRENQVTLLKKFRRRFLKDRQKRWLKEGDTV